MDVLTNLMAFDTLKRRHSFSHCVLTSSPFSFCFSINLWSEFGSLTTFSIQCLAPRSYFTGYIAKVFILLHSGDEWTKNMGHASALGLASRCSLGISQSRNDPPGMKCPLLGNVFIISDDWTNERFLFYILGVLRKWLYHPICIFHSVFVNHIALCLLFSLSLPT